MLLIGVIVKQNDGVVVFTASKTREKLVSLLWERYHAELSGSNFDVPTEFGYLFAVPSLQCMSMIQAFDDGTLCEELNGWYERMNMQDLERQRVALYESRFYRTYQPLRRQLVRLVCCGMPFLENRIFNKMCFDFMTATLIKSVEALSLFDKMDTVKRMITLQKK